ncbi:hypothetical protein B0O80DRAFT_432629 [Mortierella sp. GBAus27b]|nr:hypothetical protein BGX31_001302 [Mortierella sp. GBA43]KAI8363066.1 hypothetical protein B0O80DRAFT_432629 [Mortierella sp. GBAus27b]
MSSNDTHLKLCAEVSTADYVMLQGRPCRVTDVQPADERNTTLYGKDVFRGDDYQQIFYTPGNVIIPIITETSYRVVGISADGLLSLLRDNGEMVETNVYLPEGYLGENLQAAYGEGGEGIEVTVDVYEFRDEIAVATFYTN